MTQVAQALSEYLNAVTAPFPADTAARLRRELQEHALDTAEALEAQGHPDPIEAALRHLGGVHEVRCALERQHYTQAEEDTLLTCRFSRRHKRPSVFSLALGMAVPLGWPLVLLLLERPVVWGVYAALCVLVLALVMLQGWVPRHFPPRSARVLLALLHLGVGPALLAGLLGLTLAGQDTLWAGLLGILLGVWLGVRRDGRALLPLLPKALARAR